MAFLGETFGVDDLPQSDRNYELIPEAGITPPSRRQSLATPRAALDRRSMCVTTSLARRSKAA